MQFFNLILADTETAIYTILIRLIGEDVVAELKADIVESFKWIYLADYRVLWLFVFRVALEENEDTAVLLLETFSEEDFVDVHIFLLLAHHLESYSLWVQVVSVSFKAPVPIGEVQLVRDLLMLIHTPHLFEIRPKQANIFNETVAFLIAFWDLR